MSATPEMQFKTESPEETLALGKTIGRCLKRQDIVLFHGDLGAGKTTLTQGICNGLGMTDYVRSPTFTLINEYSGSVPIYHIDLYRLDTFADVNNLGLEDYLFGEGVTLVEWAENLKSPEDASLKDSFGIDKFLEIRILSPGPQSRLIHLSPTLMPEHDWSNFPLQK